MKIRPLAISLALLATSGLAMADDCAVTIDSNDAMQFATKEISVDKSCKNFTVHLNHTGKLAKNVMGHNWVLTKADDVRAVAQEGMSAGLDSQVKGAGFCRDGFFTLDQSVSRYHLWLNGECRDGATDDDRREFGESGTIDVTARR